MRNVIKGLTLLLLGLISMSVHAQNQTIVEGYAYENGNRGYLDVVQVTAIDKATNVQVAQVYTNADGFFSFETTAGQPIEISVVKDMFETKSKDLTPTADKKNFVQFEMKRAPGYIFEITMAEKRDDESIPVDAIKGTRVEVYNNTKREEVLAYEDYQFPEFRVNLQKGNHYTILIRKNGYLAKRMEAFVDVKGCILCFEGIGSVRPGVSETMTEGNDNGLLLANVELEKVFTGKKMEIENIYYGLDKWNITEQAKTQLNTVIQLMQDNPRLILELGSHTDSRGKAAYNMELSQKRAKAAVEYLENTGDIKPGSITYRGYGESQPTNKCKDGVKCTEAQHAANRRTELKITGMFAESRVKSLLQMKTEKEFEQDLLSGESASDQLELLPGETLEDALARIKLEKEEKTKLLGSGRIIKATDIETAPKVEIKNTDASENEEIIKNMEVLQKQETIDDKKQNIDASFDPIEKTASSIKVDAEEKTEQIQQVNDTETLNQVTESPLKTLNVDVPKFDEDATGIFVTVNRSGRRLPLTHKVYKDFTNLNWYQASDNSYYYILNKTYPTVEAAQTYIDTNIINDYPTAKIIRFDNGVRLK